MKANKSNQESSTKSTVMLNIQRQSDQNTTQTETEKKMLRLDISSTFVDYQWAASFYLDSASILPLNEQLCRKRCRGGEEALQGVNQRPVNFQSHKRTRLQNIIKPCKGCPFNARSSEQMYSGYSGKTTSMYQC